MFASLGKLVRTQGIAGIYGGLIPIMCKQIPFTITQFLVFEAAATVIYKEFAKRDFKDVGAKFGTGITFGCGVMSGVAAAIVSQPGDTVLSVMNKAPGTNLFQAVQQLGPAGMYRGLGARCVHVTSFIAAQFLIYDSIKRAFGIEVPGPPPAAPDPAPLSCSPAPPAVRSCAHTAACRLLERRRGRRTGLRRRSEADTREFSIPATVSGGHGALPGSRRPVAAARGEAVVLVERR